MAKFGRNYVLTVQEINSTPTPLLPVTIPLLPTVNNLVITPPFTMEFDISRSLLSSANYGSIRVYNLSQATRSKILKDEVNYDDQRTVTLQAGYGDSPNFPIIFTGNITRCWSVREGNNFITQIEAFDGGYAFQNSFFSDQFSKNTDDQKIIQTIAAKTKGVTVGAIGDYSNKINTKTRGAAHADYCVNLLADLTGNGVFIDNNKINCLHESEYIFTEGPPFVVDTDSGLLGTPVRQQYMLRFDILFEPNIIVGQQIQLISSTGNNYNGFFKVSGVKHHGTISDAVCGDAVTTLEVLYGFNLLTPVKQQT